METTSPMQAADQMQQAASYAPQQTDANQPPQAPPPQAPPVEAVSSPQGTQLIQVQPAAPPPRHGITGVLDAVADMLAGRNAPDQISYDENGQRQVTQGAPLSRGQKIAKIALTGIQGAATAAAAPPGPGHTAQGVAMALGQQQANEQRDSQEREQRAQQDYQRQQQAKVQKINYQILSRKLISDQLSDQLRKQAGTREQVDFSNKQIDREKQLGSFDLGFVNGAADIADLGNKDPDLIKDYHDGRVVAWPVYDENGKNLGLQVFRRKADVNAQPLPDGQQVYKFIPPHEGKPATLSSYTPAQGSLSVGEANNLNTLEYQKYSNWLKDQADLAYKGAQTAHAKAGAAAEYAAAGKANAERHMIENATSSGEIDQIANAIYSGNMDPSQLSKRAKSYDAVIARLQTINGGRPYNIAQATTDYKYANNNNTQNTLKYLNSLTGSDGKSGNLALVVQMSHDPALGLHDLPALNKVDQWAKLEQGNPKVAAYRAALTEVADQTAKILQGGGNSGTSDAKLKQASEIYGKDFSPSMIAGVAGALGPLLNNRKTEMIGNNRYLQNQFGAPQQAAPATPAGAAVQPPPIDKLPPNHDVTFANGQTWRNVNGQARQVVNGQVQ